MRSDQLIPVDRGLKHFLLKPDLVVALELVGQLHRVAKHAGQPVIYRLVFRILPIECGFMNFHLSLFQNNSYHYHTSRRVLIVATTVEAIHGRTQSAFLRLEIPRPRIKIYRRQQRTKQE